MSSNARGLYSRDGVWYARIRRNGRQIRVSTRTGDIEKAITFRRALATRVDGRYVDEPWIEQVEAWSIDSNSWLRTAHANMRHKTKKRHWGICITFNEFVDIVKRSNGLCAITGLPMSVVPGTQKRHEPFGLSIDRIESELGYVAGNIRLVCLAVNIAMRNWGEGSLRTIARAIVGRELTEVGHGKCTVE